MKTKTFERSKSKMWNAGKRMTGWGINILILSLMLLISKGADAHCDGVDGPVVKAAQKALDVNNVSLVLIWVQSEDESFIREAFNKAMKLRKMGAEAKELADTWFFETLVRIHRAGEGAGYTGLKPAGRDLGPAIPAGDEAMASGNPKEVWSLISTPLHSALHAKFEKVVSLKEYDGNDVEKGRQFVAAYVDYIHFIESAYGLGQLKEGHASRQQPAPHIH